LLKVPKVTFIALKKATILLISFMITSWIAIMFLMDYFVIHITKTSLHFIFLSINKNETFITKILNLLFSFTISETEP